MMQAQANRSYRAVEWGEHAWLDPLRDFHILDKPRSAGFDQIVEWAVDIFDAPIAIVNFIGADRLWFKTEIGFDAAELLFDMSICRHAVLERTVFFIPDLRLDPRFVSNPLVDVPDGLGFYAGVAIETQEGFSLGTVCVLDRHPRPDGITDGQRRGLDRLARQTMTLLESHLTEYRAKQRANEDKTLINEAPIGIVYFDRDHDPDGAYVRRWVPELAAVHGDALLERRGSRRRPPDRRRRDATRIKTADAL